jgi:non-heme chloroperoxidase
MPFTSRESSDVALSYIDTKGTGNAVVLIHGWPLNKKSWAVNIASLMANGYRVIAYDRRGFGESDMPEQGYDYDTLADDLNRLLTELDVTNVSLVGFSMGGGEVARYIARYGEHRLASVVFASAVPPFLLQTPNNPNGPLSEQSALALKSDLQQDRTKFFENFTTTFFSAGTKLRVTEKQRQATIAMCEESDVNAALECMEAFATTDFRADLTLITVPTLIIHGDADQTVPFTGSGKRTHEIVKHSQLHVISEGPHGINTSDSEEFDRVVISFLNARVPHQKSA